MDRSPSLSDIALYFQCTCSVDGAWLLKQPQLTKVPASKYPSCSLGSTWLLLTAAADKSTQLQPLQSQYTCSVDGAWLLKQPQLTKVPASNYSSCSLGSTWLLLTAAAEKSTQLQPLQPQKIFQFRLLFSDEILDNAIFSFICHFSKN